MDREQFAIDYRAARLGRPTSALASRVLYLSDRTDPMVGRAYRRLARLYRHRVAI